MPELCALVAKAGPTHVQSYINSGNLVFEAGKLKPDSVVRKIEKFIEDHFGFSVDVLVRTATQWKKYATGSPFPAAEKSRPHLLHLGLSKQACAKNFLIHLDPYLSSGEKIKRVGDAIWVDFRNGAGQSKLTPVRFNQAAGSPVTMRNWNTVLKLNELLQGE